MAGKINATVLAAVLVAVVVTMTTTSSVIMTADARLDLSSLVGYMGINEAETTSFQVPESTTKKEACCDFCICTRSLPPQCQCTDIKPYCHSKCKRCRCTKSIPPQCRCLDIDDFCYPTCSSSSSSSSNDAAAAFINGIAN